MVSFYLYFKKIIVSKLFVTGECKHLRSQERSSNFISIICEYILWIKLLKWIIIIINLEEIPNFMGLHKKGNQSDDSWSN